MLAASSKVILFLKTLTFCRIGYIYSYVENIFTETPNEKFDVSVNRGIPFCFKMDVIYRHRPNELSRRSRQAAIF